MDIEVWLDRAGAAPWGLLGALLTLAAVVALLFAERADSHRGRLAFKPLASAGFLCFALGTGITGTVAGTTLFVGLCLAAVGDILLIFPGQRAFLGGLVAFLLGHVAYTVSFVLAGPRPLWMLVAALLIVPLTALLYVDLRPKIPAAMMRPVMAYMVVITVMVICAAGLPPRHPALATLTLGAFLFYLSDISVALDRFAEAGFGNRALGLPLYYVAQLIIGGAGLAYLAAQVA